MGKELIILVKNISMFKYFEKFIVKEYIENGLKLLETIFYEKRIHR
jgi:hypothetical protein